MNSFGRRRGSLLLQTLCLAAVVSEITVLGEEKKKKKKRCRKYEDYEDDVQTHAREACRLEHELTSTSRVHSDKVCMHTSTKPKDQTRNKTQRLLLLST